MQCPERVDAPEPKCKMVETDVAEPIEWNRLTRTLCLPKRHHDLPIRDEDRRIGGITSDDLPAELVSKEGGGLLKLTDRQTDVVDS